MTNTQSVPFSHPWNFSCILSAYECPDSRSAEKRIEQTLLCLTFSYKKLTRPAGTATWTALWPGPPVPFRELRELGFGFAIRLTLNITPFQALRVTVWH
jgi:hypothetical protein